MRKQSVALVAENRRLAAKAAALREWVERVEADLDLHRRTGGCVVTGLRQHVLLLDGDAATAAEPVTGSASFSSGCRRTAS
jgi:hypothetical protein